MYYQRSSSEQETGLALLYSQIKPLLIRFLGNSAAQADKTRKQTVRDLEQRLRLVGSRRCTSLGAILGINHTVSGCGFVWVLAEIHF
eukprot:scaffold78476_cov35-Prasinocladus_malaysianus.AAC.1